MNDKNEEGKPTQEENLKKELKFSDVAFKPSDDGKLICEVVEVDDVDFEDNASYDFSQPAEEDELSDYNSYSSWNNHRFEFLDPDSLHVHYADEIENPHEHLRALIGLDDLKKQIKEIEMRVAFDKQRFLLNLNNQIPSNHFTFFGNPGTGKNEVARILGAIFKDMGVLSKGHVVEVDRSDLVMGYVGQSALKTDEIVKFAQGGILFIDEAYSLIQDGLYDFGYEVITTLLKRMEDLRDDLIIVFAGYEDEMTLLLNSNEGFKSRVRHHLKFEDYNAENLKKIFIKFCEDNHYVLDDDAHVPLNKLFELSQFINPKKHGNGRFSRNVFDKVIDKMALRVMSMKLTNEKDLKTICFNDIPKISDVIKDAKDLKMMSDKVSAFKTPKDK